MHSKSAGTDIFLFQRSPNGNCSKQNQAVCKKNYDSHVKHGSKGRQIWLICGSYSKIGAGHNLEKVLVQKNVKFTLVLATKNEV